LAPNFCNLRLQFYSQDAADWACGLSETIADVVAELPEAIGLDEVAVAETNGVEDEVSLDEEDVC
jgi:hypothetical protein